MRLEAEERARDGEGQADVADVADSKSEGDCWRAKGSVKDKEAQILQINSGDTERLAVLIRIMVWAVSFAEISRTCAAKRSALKNSVLASRLR